MATLSRIPYPPNLPEDRLEIIHSAIQDWQITHGSLIKSYVRDEDNNVLARPIGVSLFPTLFPRRLFHQAMMLQEVYNELYARLSEDEIWLQEVLADLIVSDPFAKALWHIHRAAKEMGRLQQITLGIFRSDYMLHSSIHTDLTAAGSLSIKQVEFNTFSCAGGTHGNIVNNLHHHLVRTGAYTTSSASNPISSSSLPITDTISSIVSALVSAHSAYGAPRSSLATTTAVLMPVQPNNINICDERPLEYALWDRSIPTYRAEFPVDLLSRTSLTATRELLFYPAHSTQPVEISLVYMRAGYDAEEHDDAGIEARIRIEASRAIKVPTVLGQLATFKKVQQALALPGSVERFLEPNEATMIRKTFAPMWPLDGSEKGKTARELARDPSTAVHYVLKPSLEGGGHNIYRNAIPAFLSHTPEREWRSYILMEMISPPSLKNILISPRGIHQGGVVGELGVFGTVLWKRHAGSGDSSTEILENKEAGWSFKTKADDIDEMSVIKGYGCFDTPCLVDD